jgi:CheY-like chemotaxis protein
MTRDTILIVEDDADILDSLVDALEDDGHEVVTAVNGQQALDKLRQADHLPRLILLDLMMPVMDRWQFRAAQASDPALAHVPVILLSAHVNVREAAAELGVTRWLKKPVDLEALLAAVAAVSAETILSP